MINNAVERVRAWLEQPNAPLDDELRMHAGASLAQAGEWKLLGSLLTDFSPTQRWAEARFAVEGSYSGYLSDLEILSEHAEGQRDLGLCIRIALIKSTIHSLSSNILPELLVQFVTIGTTSGKLRVEAALELIAQQVQGENQQVRSIEALLRANLVLPWQRALEIVEKQVYPGERLRGLLALFSIVPPSSQAEIAQRILSISGQHPEQIHFASLYHAQFVPLKLAGELWRLFLQANSDTISYLEYYWDIVPSSLQTKLEPTFRRIARRMLWWRNKQQSLHALPFLPSWKRSYRTYGDILTLVRNTNTHLDGFELGGFTQDELRFWRNFSHNQQSEVLQQLQKIVNNLDLRDLHTDLYLIRRCVIVAAQMEDRAQAQLLIEQATELILGANSPQYFQGIIGSIPARYHLPIRDWLLQLPASASWRRVAFELTAYLEQQERQPLFEQLALQLPAAIALIKSSSYIDKTIVGAIAYLPTQLQQELLEELWSKCRVIGDQIHFLLLAMEYGKLDGKKLQLKGTALQSDISTGLANTLFQNLYDQQMKDHPRALIPFLPFFEAQEAERLAEAIWLAGTSPEEKRSIVLSLPTLIDYLSLERRIQLRQELVANPQQELAEKLLTALSATDQAGPELISVIGQLRPDNLLIQAVAALVARFDLADYPQQLADFISVIKTWEAKAISGQRLIDFSPILPQLSHTVIEQIYQALEEETDKTDPDTMNTAPSDQYLVSKLLLVPYLSQTQQVSVAQQVSAQIQANLAGLVKRIPHFRNKHITANLAILSPYLAPEQINLLFQTFVTHFENTPAYLWCFLFPSFSQEQIAQFFTRLQQTKLGIFRYLEVLLRSQPENDLLYAELIAELEPVIADGHPLDVFEIVGEVVPYLREAEQIRFIPVVLQQLPEVYGEQGTEEVLPIVLECMLKQNLLDLVPIEHYIEIISQLRRSEFQRALNESKDWIFAAAQARQQPEALTELSQALLEISYAWP